MSSKYHFSFVLCGVLVVVALLATSDSLKIGAFNVRIFGQTKARKDNVMGYLAKVAIRYDILLIQEIRDSARTAISLLLKRIKRDHGVEMSSEISDRLGRTASKEQYAYLYRADLGISVLDKYHFDDGNEELRTDLFEREPYIVRFRARDSTLKDFTLVAIHVAPESAVPELQSLTRVYDDVSRKWKTPDILILGDLNAACDYVRKKYWPDITIRQRSEFWWPIGDDMDTTVNSNTDCAYDRFIVAGTALRAAVVPGSAGVFDFQAAYRLSEQQALEVSDHYPIELTLRSSGGTSRDSSKATTSRGIKDLD